MHAKKGKLGAGGVKNPAAISMKHFNQTGWDETPPS